MNRIAVIDDHRLVLDGMTTWLQVECPDLDVVISANSWAEFVASPSFPPAVAVVDIDLRDSIPLSAKIQTLRVVGSKTVLVTSMAAAGMLKSAVLAGVDGIAFKSEPASEIVACIRSAMDGRQRLSPGVTEYIAIAAGSPMLSDKEREVMRLYVDGMSMKEIATDLSVSEDTAKTHMKRLRRKYSEAGIDVGTKVLLRKQAINDGIIGEF